MGARSLGVMPDAYLDHAATTPLRPEAAEAMLPLLHDHVGNPSGSHRWAREARRRLDDARDLVAAFVGADPAEVVFTSGGTEADNLAIRGGGGGADDDGGRPRGVWCSAVEHHAVLEPVRALAGSDLAVDGFGRVDLSALRTRLAAEAPPRLVSVMTANNETGARNDLDAIAALLTEASPATVLHTDAVAAAAWLDLPATVGRADLVTVSGHKVGGPKGIGALVVRRGTPLAAQVLGGGQEHERRAGTPNVVGAVGFAAAAAATVAERAATVARVEALRERLVTGLVAAIADLVVLSPSDPAERTAGTVQVGIPGVDRESLVFLLDRAGIAASWGSSCASGATEPSHVLAAMGVAASVAAGALRLSLGWSSTAADVDAVLDALPGVVTTLRTAA